MRLGRLCHPKIGGMKLAKTPNDLTRFQEVWLSDVLILVHNELYSVDN